MSYTRPSDPYMHSNESQYDERYQQGGYSDYPDKSPGYGGSNSYGQNAATNAAATYSYAKPKKGMSKWIKFGIPLAILIIAGAVVGGVVGSRSSGSDDDSSGSTSNRSNVGKGSDAGADSGTLSASAQAAKQGGNNQLFYQGTDVYGNPAFVTKQVDTAAPSFSGRQHNSTCSDTFSGGSLTNLRPHPRIIATKAEWDCLGEKIANDAYLTLWNQTIFHNATAWLTAPVTNYFVDGGPTGSGILDVSREVQMRVKALAYAFKMSGDQRYKTRLFRELNTAAGNSGESNWSQNTIGWNPQHFLDVAEMTSAFAMAYDWLHDDWSQDERDTILGAIVNRGLVPGQNQYATGDGWWKTTNSGNGNWNCVCNGGLLTGALAIRGDGNSTENGIADSIINSAVQNMKDNCMRGVYTDGTWSETPNYWYFGTNAQARALSTLISATGSDQGLQAVNPNWYKTSDFHMYVTGNAGMFFYGDNGPGKFATTANQLMLYSKLSGDPRGALFQRDRSDASFDPLSMFWYDPATIGAFWNGLPLDRFFDNDDGGQWASMRSSWTDTTGVYVGVKASNATGHQTHGDLDAGTFVVDALGTRWAGEYGNGNYLSQDYFSNETDSSARWTYYRKATQGQNTLVLNNQNQVANCLPVNKFETTNPVQSAALDYKPGTNDVAYFISDLSSCYSLGQGVVQRGIRMLNGRRQVLVRDEIAQSGSINNIKWRVQTNGTVTLSSDGKTATLKLSKITDVNAGVTGTLNLDGGEKTMVVKILSPSNGRFTTDGPPATRIYGQPVASPPPEVSDQENRGVTALQIEVDDTSAASTIEVVWQPQWSDLTDADRADPKSVSLSLWSLTSHNA
ncbi:uncharacterized protein PFL1_03435 [Pseudozyma flocculosa PF-1]|uniref:Heparinase II/III-like C-terminal domain-containing protein n=2 Tax=Pseudozyma flocculosa TaxID=84751 RepID=A0A5C3FBP3_9BASI|nr:uncharacterized protein PFL1_03435 [Pseudozyma flocculosa PF-1]EPQ29148.1 hypothetical protein PFL1_03435 [Pseudozyma flocculosa PF-1]SPO41556.1 uncharacterized protein PSFLO_07038 [Pseudozyma flocculosa]